MDEAEIIFTKAMSDAALEIIADAFEYTDAPVYGCLDRNVMRKVYIAMLRSRPVLPRRNRLQETG